MSVLFKGLDALTPCPAQAVKYVVRNYKVLIWWFVIALILPLGGVNTFAMTTDTDTARVIKPSDSTSTTSSEAESQGMHGSIRKRLVRRQSALCTYQRRTAGVDGRCGMVHFF